MAESLSEARAKVEESDRQRRQLFADITHELATPLTSIRGYAETLLDPTVSVSGDERGRFVRGVLEEARRLDRLIRDLFDLARLEAGATQLQRERLDWVELCRNTANRFSTRFADAGLRIEWGETIPEAWIVADGHRMEQVLENLLGNALRYVPTGGHVGLSLTSTNGAGTYRLRVNDDGPGLSDEELSHVFERFYRAPGARGSASRDGGGSGLGLAIVREIVERHGGSVRAEASLPHGLAITIELPRQR
jgi:two-component system sensor histidine kinase ResE